VLRANQRFSKIVFKFVHFVHLVQELNEMNKMNNQLEKSKTKQKSERNLLMSLVTNAILGTEKEALEFAKTYK
jgi:hypothetical protein